MTEGVDGTLQQSQFAGIPRRYPRSRSICISEAAASCPIFMSRLTAALSWRR